MEEFNFESLEEIRIPVRLPPSLRDGDERLMLCEADDEASSKYEDAKLSCSRFDSAGKLNAVEGLTEKTEPLLVALCLWRVDANGNKVERLTEARIKQWPSKIVRPLFDRAMEISELDDSAPDHLRRRIKVLSDRLEQVERRGDVLKNGQGATTGGSG